MNAQAHYIRLYKAADEILRQPDNPCQIRRENGHVTCTGSRANQVPHDRLCCGGCEHLGPEGCTAMALSCKLGWCFIVRDTITGMQVEDHPTFAAIRELRSEAHKLGIRLWSRCSFAQTF
jgi:hypothetical protein